MKKIQTIIIAFLRWITNNWFTRQIEIIIDHIVKKHTEEFLNETQALLKQKFGLDSRVESMCDYEGDGRFHTFEFIGVNYNEWRKIDGNDDFNNFYNERSETLKKIELADYLIFERDRELDTKYENKISEVQL